MLNLSVIRIDKDDLTKKNLLFNCGERRDKVKILMPIHIHSGIHEFRYQVEQDFCYVLGRKYEWDKNLFSSDDIVRFIKEVISPIDHCKWTKSSIPYFFYEEIRKVQRKIIKGENI